MNENNDIRKTNQLTAVFEYVDGWYIAYIAEIDGVHTQGKTLEEAKENLVDAYNHMMECRLEDIKKSKPDAIIEPFTFA